MIYILLGSASCHDMTHCSGNLQPRFVKHDSAENVSTESRNAWEIWKKLTDFSEFLWDAYEYDFLTLAASEPPPKNYPSDDASAMLGNHLPF